MHLRHTNQARLNERDADAEMPDRARKSLAGKMTFPTSRRDSSNATYSLSQEESN